MYLKKGDTIEIISGKDAGKRGKIMRAIPKEEKVVIEGLNTVRRRQRPRQEGQKGQTVEVAMPIVASNVMLVCPKTDKRTRISQKKENGKVVRFSKKGNVRIE